MEPSDCRLHYTTSVTDAPTFLILISGPTGTGKSAVAVSLAALVDGEIINADSIQIYRGFDIGSAKPAAELIREVPHHLYDCLDPDEHLDVARWVELATGAITTIARRGKTPIIVGGTNFYLRALLRGLPELPPRQPELRARLEKLLARSSGIRHLHRLLRTLDPVSAERIAPSDRHRIERAIEVYAASGRPISAFEPPSPDIPSQYPYLQFALSLERDVLRERIAARVRSMYAGGLVDEVRGLLARYPEDLRPFGSIGYREAKGLIAGEIDEEEAISITIRRTWAYARRQMTWLRAERDVQWVNASEPIDAIVQSMVKILREHRKESGSDAARRNRIR